MLMGFDELPRIPALHQPKADEQPSEQQDFRRQEQPHTDLAGIELLLHRGKMMLMVRIVTMGIVRVNINSGGAHAWVTGSGR